jgi:SAM-dependent methyltransferase
MTAPQAITSYAPLIGRVACPRCRRILNFSTAGMSCTTCSAEYRIVDGVLDLAPSEPNVEERAWLEHWSEDNQESVQQRFFSFYRKAVFARTVRHFTSEWFPPAGTFLEAGSGTSETSMRVDTHGGARVLVALDLVMPVLRRCHPVMRYRIRGDIFTLPFATSSLDGIWNVGVMEHFTHDRIDAILREFHRVLRPGGRVILLWPAAFSVPQKMLRVCELFINLRRRGSKFRFHPDEISQLRSIREGREVLSRNAFRPLHIDPGFRSLLAFETVVGERIS